MKPIFLIGYMGSGKSTFGRALARCLNKEFIDLDFYIEQRFRMSISRIFKEKGEKEFRRMESNLLREAGEFEDVIIACGGGTPCFDDNMDFMNTRGLTICLEAKLGRLMERLRLKPGKRPLIDGMNDVELRNFIVYHLEERSPFYSQCELRLESSELENVKEIDMTIKKFISENVELLEKYGCDFENCNGVK